MIPVRCHEKNVHREKKCLKLYFPFCISKKNTGMPREGWRAKRVRYSYEYMFFMVRTFNNLRFARPLVPGVLTSSLKIVNMTSQSNQPNRPLVRLRASGYCLRLGIPFGVGVVAAVRPKPKNPMKKNTQVSWRNPYLPMIPHWMKGVHAGRAQRRIVPARTGVYKRATEKRFT